MAVAQQKDAYTWIALYRDGGYISEYDRPDGRGFAEVDSLQVKEMKLESSDMARRSHFIDIPEGAEPVFFRRRSVALNLVDGSSSPVGTAHCIGWKRGEQAVYLFVTDQGDTILTDNLQAI